TPVLKRAVLLDDSLPVGFEILRPMPEGQEIAMLIVMDTPQTKRRPGQLGQKIMEDEKGMVPLIDVAADKARELELHAGGAGIEIDVTARLEQFLEFS